MTGLGGRKRRDLETGSPKKEVVEQSKNRGGKAGDKHGSLISGADPEATGFEVGWTQASPISQCFTVLVEAVKG